MKAIRFLLVLFLSFSLMTTLGGVFWSTDALAVPEIEVVETGTIADGGSLDVGTKAAGTAVTVTFSVRNYGDTDLTLETATSSALSNVVVNTISAPSSTTVPGMDIAVFTVQYTPTAAGAFSFDLSFANNDSDENPYNFTVSGTATGTPEIAVAETGQGQGAVADGGTLGQGTQTAGSAVPLTFTVTNSGTGNLTLATATSSSLFNVTIGSISAPTSTTVAPSGGTTTFTVQYTPTLAGAFSFNLSFTNDDSDENPYNFTVSGTATGTPEIAVAETGQGQGAVADGGTLGQGTQTAGSAVPLTFTVTNSGTGNLTLATATSSSFSNVTIGSISAPASTTVTGGGGTTTFTVQYTPTAAGAFSFDLSFANNDSDENPYNFAVSGTAPSPEIAVAETGQGQGAVPDDGTLAQGTRTAGSAVNLTFTVVNSGAANLTLATATSSSPSNVTVNSISAPASTTIAPSGGTTTFSVRYTPTAAGAFSFSLSFANNDGDENPYNFTVSGTATGTPEIAVSSSEGGAVADGGTDSFSSTPSAGSSATVTYTISNNGTDSLSVSAPTVGANVTSTTNVTVNSFTLGATSVAASGTTTLEVNYTPTIGGAFSFAFNFANSDGDENPYNIIASGNSAGVADGLAATSGSGQAAPVNTSFANPLVATVTDGGGNGLAGVSVTFTAPASGASLVFASTGTTTETVVTGAGGTATSSMMTANATASGFSGGSLTSYSVSASVSGLTSVSFFLTNARDATADIAKTSDVIAAFMTNRADRIVSAQPDLVSRLRSPFGSQSQANRFFLNAGPGSQTVNLEASLLAFVNKINAPKANTLATTPSSDPFAAFDALDQGRTGTAPGLAMAYAAPSPSKAEDATATLQDKPQSGFDAWLQGTFVATQNGTSDQQSGMFFAGVDYRFDEGMLVGFLGELDTSDETNTTAKANGTGWMAGPYAVVRLSENLYLDGQVTYGQSDNNINALGLFTDRFSTERLLLQAGLTGDFRIEDFTFNPFVRATYFWEEQKSYVDSLGNTIPDQAFDLGRLEFGPRVSWDVPTSGEVDLGFDLGLSGIYEFNQLSNGAAATPALASVGAPLRARIEAGVDIGMRDTGFRITLDGFYDGIGVTDFQAYGASLNVGASF